MSEEQSENIEPEEIPLTVEIVKAFVPEPKEIPNPTSEDTTDFYDIILDDVEQKEMEDAQ